MRLRTFGGLEITGSDFSRPKPLLLLAYLAVEGPKARRHVADVFYVGTTDPNNGLSRALSLLKDALPETFALPGQKIEGLVECDARLLLRLLDEGDLEAALELYQGPFLDGVDVAMGEELEEWVFTTREFLAARVRAALLRDGERLLAAGDAKGAVIRADAAYVLAGAPELEPEDFQRVYSVLWAGGHPRAAAVRATALSYGLTLTQTVSVPPSPLTRSETPERSSLPDVKTSFVGRQEQLTEIVDLLAGAECRLLTLLGPGGVGKSRLALEVARTLMERAAFPEGVYFLPLESLATPSLIPARLAEVLSLDIRTEHDLLAGVKRAIGDRRVLLVLDACEKLDGEHSVLTALLSDCPNLKVLTTSRERLRLADEWLYTLVGLTIPERDTELFGSGAPAAAVELFVQRAKRARLQFALTPNELPHVVRICQLVGGFPLGIELSAAWVSALAPAEILREMEKNFDFLEQSDEIGSVRAVFEASWRRLKPDEKRVLRRLSVFYGGFRKDAAAAVTGATTPVLTALVDRSLLRLDADGRYDRHALLYQYMREKLADEPEEKARTRERHADYYHSLLRSAGVRLRSAGAKDAAASLGGEMANLRLAWNWTLQRSTIQIARSAPPLRVFFDREGRFAEGADLFAQAASHLWNAQDEDKEALGIVLIEQAWLVFRMGRRQTATTLAERGLTLVKPAGSPRNVREGLLIIGALRLDAGQYAYAKTVWTEALELAEAGTEDEAHSLELLALAEELGGDFEEAQGHYRQSLDLSLQLGDKESTVDTLNNLATLLIDAGGITEAESLLKRGLKLAHELGAHRLRPYLLDNLAKVACEGGDPDRAASLAAEALRLARDSGEKPLEARALETLSRASLASGDYAAAQDYIKAGLEISVAMNATLLKALLLLRVAELSVARQQYRQAAALVGLLKSQSALTGAGRNRTQALLRALADNLPESDLRDELSAGERWRLDDAVETAIK